MSTFVARKYILNDDKTGRMDAVPRGKFPIRIEMIGKSSSFSALKGDLFEELPENEQPKDIRKVAVVSVVDNRRRLETEKRFLQFIDDDTYNLLAAVPSCTERWEAFSQKTPLEHASRLIGNVVRIRMRGDRKELDGTIRYIGPLSTKAGTYFGVELKKPKGNTDGKDNGKQLFVCAENYGLFVPVSQILFGDNSSKEGGRRPGNGVIYKSGKEVRKKCNEDLSQKSGNQSGRGGASNFKDQEYTHTCSSVTVESRVVAFVAKSNGKEKVVRGTVKYIGRPSKGEAVPAGIELDTDDGFVRAVYKEEELFKCTKNRALIVPIVSVIEESDFDQGLATPPKYFASNDRSFEMAKMEKNGHRITPGDRSTFENTCYSAEQACEEIREQIVLLMQNDKIVDPSIWRRYGADAIMNHVLGRVVIIQEHLLNLRQDNEVLNTERDVRIQGLELSRRQNITLEEELRNSNERYCTTRQRYEEVITERDNIMSELQELRTELSRSRQRNEEVITERDNIMSELSRSRQRYEEVKTERDNIMSELQELRTELSRSRQRNEEVITERDNIMSELSRSRQRYEEVVSERDTIMSELQELRTELSRSRQRNKEVVTEKNTIMSELQGLRTELSRSRQRNEDVITERNNIISELQGLRTELSRSRQRNEEVITERNNIRSELQELRSGLSRGRQRNEISIAREERRDWEINITELARDGTLLGQGAYGSVTKRNFRGMEVAVKEMHGIIESDYNREKFRREMKMAASCRCPYLVQFIGAVVQNDHLLYITEVLETDLRRALSRDALRDSDILNIATDVAKALCYLHAMREPLIHRDVSSPNVLLWHARDGFRGKLSDYGSVNLQDTANSRYPGNAAYSAPEANSPDQTVKMDVYSFGVLFCEMCIREVPEYFRRDEQVSSIHQNSRKELVQRCIRVEPTRRPPSHEVLGALRDSRSSS